MSILVRYLTIDEVFNLRRSLKTLTCWLVLPGNLELEAESEFLDLKRIPQNLLIKECRFRFDQLAKYNFAFNKVKILTVDLDHEKGWSEYIMVFFCVFRSFK